LQLNKITFIATNVINQPRTNFVLETSVNLSTDNWQTVTNAVAPSGDLNTLALPMSDAVRFFRLKSGN
jgi:hypothetical protein